jgi:hypothetical protein
LAINPIKSIPLLFIILLLFSKVCFSQIETKIKYVGATTTELPGLNIGIVIGKIDTSYYMRFRLYIPSMEYKEVYLSRKSYLSIALKSGKAIYLNLEKASSSILKHNEVNDFILFQSQDGHITFLTIPVSKQQLLQISKEPFESISLPYFENPTKSDELIFSRPPLFRGKRFLLDDISYILSI